ncbi:rhodanese-like domain-containing protein [Paenibacillus dendritiformis]|uniref:Rhodanese-related sulfurtransferase n=1 Tax=Paenibacillus dendritiformis C454 TaxID=1131935 RepID=H3SBZ2_9BACL|nr:rhodanese-like domain-containing protein [Paenibacillus dendritiformis]EHQ63506.1 Rhodanese-related sulfurtransferase [Paenibacillus dendritiformis C454]CAH8771239.1 rhodanese-like domain-containing protein [Paenibacillus dendritiformis]
MSWKEMLPSEANQMLNAAKVRCVDVREPEEYADGHIPGAVNVPLSELPERRSELDPAQEWIVVCQAGGRSTRACQYLSSIGYDRLHNMSGGMNDWAGEVE